MEKRYTTIKQVRKNVEFLSKVEIYKPIGILRRIVGFGLIYTGIATLPLPTGSVFAIALGCSIVSIDHNKLLSSIRFYTTETLRALYGLRSLKLIKYNIRLRFL